MPNRKREGHDFDQLKVPLIDDKANIAASPSDKPNAVTNDTSFVISHLDPVAGLIWIYIVIKLLVVDFDVFLLLKIRPYGAWLVEYKFFLIILTSVTCLLLLRRRFVFSVLYVAVFLLVLIGVKLPIFVLRRRSWTLAFSIINLILSLYRSFTLNYTLLGLLLVASFFIVISDNAFLLYVCGSYFLVYLGFSFLHTVSDSFRQPEVFRVFFKVFKYWRTYVTTDRNQNIRLDDNVKSLPIKQLTDDQLTKYKEKLQIAVVYNRLCYYVANKLKNYRDSGVETLFSMAGYLWLLVQGIVTLSFINLVILKIDHSSFHYTQSPSFFLFLYYTFSSLYMGGIENLYPVSNLAIAAKITSGLFGISLLPVVIGGFVYSIREQKSKRQLDETISLIRNEGEEMNKFIRSEYKLSVEEAVQCLSELKAGLIGIIYKISTEI
jgi:hypothetical protein